MSTDFVDVESKMVTISTSVMIYPERSDVISRIEARISALENDARFSHNASAIEYNREVIENMRGRLNDPDTAAVDAYLRGSSHFYATVGEISVEVDPDDLSDCAMCDSKYLSPDSYVMQDVCVDRANSFGDITRCYWDRYDVVCYDCSDHASSCDSCGLVEHIDDINYIEINDVSLCDSCYSELAVTCNYCGEMVHRNYHDMDECRMDSADSVVNNYSYRPEPEFHCASNEVVTSSTPFMGFELEIELPYNSYYIDAAEYANDSFGSLAYLKHDGSLNNGFEIVTHPHTLAAYLEGFPFETLNMLSSQYSATSWQTETCGLHVHIGRSAFGGLTHQALFTHLIQGNPVQMRRLAGRSSEHWAKFGGERDHSGSPVTVAKKVDRRFAFDRYQAVNTTNVSTIEVRIFRGSMMPRRVLSALELVDSAFHYTQFKGANALTSGALAFDQYAKWLHAQKKYDNLKYYIKLYGLYDNHTVSN